MLVLLAPTIGILAGAGYAQGTERTGKEVVDSVCIACHGTGANGAPKIGDKKAWSKLAGRGLTGLSESALNGIRNMPPHGGNMALTDTEIERAITYMVNQSGGRWTEPVSRSAPVAERTGEQVVRAQCSKCHQNGIGGAPKIGDRAAWVPRLKQGIDPLVRSAINGHGGMPPRGGLASLTDLEIRNAIVYMFNPKLVVTAPRVAAGTAVAGQDFAVAGDTTVYFGVIAGDTIRAHPKEYPPTTYGVPPSAPDQYYVTVAVFDSGSGQRIEAAAVRARVATASGSGPEKTLQPITIAGSRSYGNYFAMGGSGPFKIAVSVKRSDSADTVQAQFDYAR
ncbi:MAG TPA: c-type cytochrome [Casimicrobiaceae bacterium]|nr:c-type cytochrome [Casimicrobiaceae bacterium]